MKFFKTTDLNNELRKKSSFSALQYLIKDFFKKKIVYVCSFGSESAVLLHMISKINNDLPIIFLNTHKLFKETLSYKTKLINQFSLKNVMECFPDDQELMNNDSNDFLWRENADLCCKIRKINPLHKKLEKFDAWISGRKAYQSGERAEKNFLEFQDNKYIISPLLNWNKKQIEQYFQRNNLPHHPLVSQGYQSIGCKNCTLKTIKNSSNPRSGRWSGLEKTECGIHFSKNQNQKFLG